MGRLIYNRSGIIVSEEKTAGSKISWIIAQQNKALIKEQKYNKNNVCSKCHMIKSKTGECNCE